MAAAVTGAIQEKMQKLTEEAQTAEPKDTAPKLGDPGVCPGCGATDQNGKFCEYCGEKLN